MNIDDIKLYLPKFLSPESEKTLLKGLKDFPNNIDARLYTKHLNEDIIYQGDGLKNMTVVNLPNNKTKKVKSLIISNTCDIDLSNRRNFPAQIVYSPIFNLKKYENSIRNNTSKTEEQITSHIGSIKKQEITQIFFLPKFDGLLEESIVFFDRVCSYPNKKIKRNNLEKDRIFTLSDYGSYLLLFKLSIHFTRIRDTVERKSV